jgi:hypothetical protein
MDNAVQAMPSTDSGGLQILPEDRIVVYLGPSLPLEQARELLDARFLPPVQLGDIYKLLSTSIETIVIIDGLFDGATPVWHREILAALEAGITVIGATSMGALRAAEMHQYGMLGHGTIFEWFRDGELDGDDEVALIHGVEELGYLKLSEPLVNIRYNLANAAAAGVISQALCDSLINECKKQYFGDRKLIELYKSCERLGYDAGPLKSYLSDHYVDLKQQDARSVLMQANALATQHNPRAEGWYQRKPRFGTMMHGLELARSAIFKLDGSAIDALDVIAAIQESAEEFEGYKLAAIERYWLLQAIKHANVVIEPAGRLAQENWCKSHGLEDLRSWLVNNGLPFDAWHHRVSEELAIEKFIHGTVHSNGELCRNIENLIQSAARLPREWLNSISADYRGARIAIVGSWALDRGYQPAIEWIDNVGSAMPDAYANRNDTRAADLIATYAWLVKDEPTYFGFSYDAVVQTYLQLQFHGAVEALA